MPDLLEVCLEAAHRGGQILLDWQDRFNLRRKGRNDLVTEADVASQEAIREIIHKAFPDHDFLGEEDAADRKANGLPAFLSRSTSAGLLIRSTARRTTFIVCRDTPFRSP